MKYVVIRFDDRGIDIDECISVLGLCKTWEEAVIMKSDIMNELETELEDEEFNYNIIIRRVDEK